MDQETRQLITEQFTKLPAALQRAIQNVDYATILQRLMSKHDLRVDKANVVENEVTLALLGFEHPNELAENLQNHVGLSDKKALELALDIDKEIFGAVRKSLRQEWAREENAEVQPTTESVPEKPVTEERPAQTMPKNVLKAKLENTVHTSPEKEQRPEKPDTPSTTYENQDPYREPIE